MNCRLASSFLGEGRLRSPTATKRGLLDQLSGSFLHPRSAVPLAPARPPALVPPLDSPASPHPRCALRVEERCSLDVGDSQSPDVSASADVLSLAMLAGRLNSW